MLCLVYVKATESNLFCNLFSHKGHESKTKDNKTLLFQEKHYIIKTYY